MISIWKRELRSQLGSVVGFLYLAASLFLFGVYFYVINLYQGSAHVSYAYASCVYLFVVTIPILTMRSFAQEYRDKTDQLLFTAPIPLRAVVLGKYLAMLTLFLIPVVIAAFFPLFLLSYGEVAIVEAYTTLLGYVLYGLAAIAIGMFLSSLTQSTVIAAVLTALVLFVAYTMGGFAELPGLSAIRNFLGVFHMQARFVTMESGELDLRSVVYFLSVAAAFILLTLLRLKQLRGGFGGNRSKRMKRGIVSVCIIVGLILINVAAAVLPDRVMQHDVTLKEYQQITHVTRSVLEGLKKDVTIHVYAREDAADVNIVKLLNNYKEFDHISVEYVDPALSPHFTENYTKNGLAENSLVVTAEDRYRTIPADAIYTYSDENMKEYGFGPDGFALESLVTSAVDYVTTENIPRIYQITGHGELTLAGKFLNAVQGENVDVNELNLTAAGEIPGDARCLLILAPGEDYSEAEIGLLRDYLERGGNLYVLLKWREEPEKHLHGFLSEYGFTVKNGIVSESDGELYFQEPYYLIPEIRETSVTKEVGGNLALSVMSLGMKLENSDIEVILKTTDKAFLKTDPQKSENQSREEGDETGEFVLGACLERTVDVTEEVSPGSDAKVTRQSKLVVFGSPYMTQETIDEYISGMNLKLFSAILSNMVSHATPVYVPVRPYAAQYVTVSQADSAFFGIILSGVLPGLVMVAGLVIWILRRRR